MSCIKLTFIFLLLLISSCSKESTPSVSEDKEEPSVLDYDKIKLSFDKEFYYVGDTITISVENPEKADLSTFELFANDTLVADIVDLTNRSLKVIAKKKGRFDVRFMSSGNLKLRNYHLEVRSHLDDGVIRILAIGNSFSEDALEYYLHQLSSSSKRKIEIGNLRISGGSLRAHLDNIQQHNKSYTYVNISESGKKVTTSNADCMSIIKSNNWDFISLQQVSDNTGLYESYFPYIEEIMKIIKPNIRYDSRFMLHQTWAYSQTSTHSGFKNYSKSQLVMYDSIASATNKIYNNLNFDFVVPAGTAIQNARNTSLGDDLTRDGYHLSKLLGRFIAACTWYEALFNDDVTTNSFTPQGLDINTSTIAKECAHFAVKNPFGITKY